MKNYLIISNFYRLINDKISELINYESEVIKYDLNIHDIKDIIAEANYNSLFDHGKNIIVYNCKLFSNSKLSDEDSKILIDYLENPNPNNIVIFVGSENEDSRKKITKILKSNNAIFNYNNIKYNVLNEHITKYIKKNSFNISEEIIGYITKSSNMNYDIVCNEIDKLCLAFGNNPTIDDARRIVSSNLTENVFKFLDELSMKNHAKAKELLDELKILKIEPATIIGLMYREYRLMFLYKFAMENNISLNDVFKSDRLMDWQINKIANKCQKLSLSYIKKIISIIANYDYLYKSGKIDRSVVLDTILIDILV